MSESLVEVRKLVKTFASSGGLMSKAKHVHAVTDVSFSVNPRETFALVGESGCGKSTTGRLVTRLLEPDLGQVLFDGADITNYTEKQMRPVRSNMQMIFQDPYGSLNPRIKVEDLIGEPLSIHTKLSTAEKRKIIYDLLEVVGLHPEHANRYPHEFSGGQRQRIGIARALTVHPKLIVADEPVSALDVSIQAQVLNLLKELQRKYELTYIFISHDLSVVEMIADKIGVMYLGKIMESAPKEELYSKPLHPYTQALLSAVPVPDPKHVRNRIILKGDLPSPVNPPSGCLFHTRCPYCAEKCKTDKPDLREIVEEHFVACHYV